MGRRFHRLRNQLIAAFLVVVLLPAATVSAYNLLRASREAVEQARREKQQVLASKAMTVEHLIQRTFADMLVLASIPEIRAYVQDPWAEDLGPYLRAIENAFLSFLTRAGGRYRGAALLNIMGEEICRVQAHKNGWTILPTDALRDRGKESYFVEAVHIASIQGQEIPIHITEVEVEPDESGDGYIPFFRCSTFLQGADASMVGVLVLQVAVDPILQVLAKDMEAKRIFVLDRHKNYLLHPDPRYRCATLRGKAELPPDRPRDLETILRDESGTLFDTPDRPGVLQVFARIRPKGQATIQWTVIYEEPIRNLLAPVRHNQYVILLTLIVSLAVAILLGVLFSNAIAGPLSRLAEAAHAVAEGDLAKPLPKPKGKNEVAHLAAAFSAMTTSLATQTEAMREGIQTLLRATENGARISEQLRSSAQATVASITESRVAAERIRETSLRAAERTVAVSSASQLSVSRAEESEAAARAMFEAMNDMRRRMEVIVTTILQLSEKAGDIAEILDTVEELADRADVLAVNAMIEAVKAGETIRGFIPIADEIASMAMGSKHATGKIRAILRSIPEGLREAIEATREGCRAMEEGGNRFAKVQEGIRRMVEAARIADETIEEIRQLSLEQQSGTEHMSTCLGTIEKSSREDLEIASEIADANRLLLALSSRLNSLVQRQPRPGLSFSSSAKDFGV